MNNKENVMTKVKVCPSLTEISDLLVGQTHFNRAECNRLAREIFNLAVDAEVTALFGEENVGE